MITFQTENIEMPAIDQAKVRDWVRNVAASYQKKVGEIAYFFCDDEKILPPILAARLLDRHHHL